MTYAKIRNVHFVHVFCVNSGHKQMAEMKAGENPQRTQVLIRAKKEKACKMAELWESHCQTLTSLVQFLDPPTGRGF